MISIASLLLALQLPALGTADAPDRPGTPDPGPPLPTAAVQAAEAGIAHVEIPVDEPQRALRFYREAFGWDIEKWGGPAEYWSGETRYGDRGTSIGLIRRARPEAQPVFTVYVPSIDEVLAQVERLGGSVVTAKTAVPGVGWEAYLVDSERNHFAVFQLDPEAR